jgi:phosphotransferase system IIA component
MDRIKLGLQQLAKDTKEGQDILSVNLNHVTAYELTACRPVVVASMKMFRELLAQPDDIAGLRQKKQQALNSASSNPAQNRLFQAVRQQQQQQQQQQSMSTRSHLDSFVSDGDQAAENNERSLRRFRGNEN